MPLTKKEKERLKSDKAQVVVPTEPPLHYTVTMSLTLGELLALKHSLEHYPTIVAEDVCAYLNNALERADVKF